MSSSFAHKAATNRILLILAGRSSSALENIVNDTLMSNADRIRLAPLSAREVVALVTQKVSRPSLAEILKCCELTEIRCSFSRRSANFRMMGPSPSSWSIRQPAGADRWHCSFFGALWPCHASRLRHISDAERSLLRLRRSDSEFRPDPAGS